MLALVLFPALAHSAQDLPSSQQLRDAIFELQSQIQGYRVRVGQTEHVVQTTRDALRLLEDRKNKLVLEKQLADLSRRKVLTQIREHDQRLALLDAQLVGENRFLAELMRQAGRISDSRIAVLAMEQSISKVLSSIDGVEQLANEIREAKRALRELRRLLDAERQQLARRHDELGALARLQQLEELRLYEDEEQKRLLLRSTAKHLDVYRDLLRGAESQSFLFQQSFFEREGVGRALSLQEVVARARIVSSRVRIREEFLLAVMAQESKFGASQGSGAWRDDMHPAQWPHFLLIMQRLGLNPDAAPVSRKPAYGWGGAMGPAQILPSTWLAYENQVTGLTGNPVPSPWNIDDALAVAALKLADAGAGARTEQAERRAALIYFAGENWDNPAFGFYADSVLDFARGLRKEIDRAVS